MKKDIESRAEIEFLVNTFYNTILEEKIIAHFFTDVAKLNFEAHLPKMYDFWEGILLGTSNYRGNPMLTHLELDKKQKIEKAHFQYWINLWTKTIQENFEGEKANEAIKRATYISDLMMFKIKV